jgi:periplasmic copper chaperone A
MMKFRARQSLLLAFAVSVVLAFASTGSAAENGLAVSKAWMRFVLPSRPAAGYFTLANTTSKAVLLVGASSPACGTLMLHKSVVEKDGAERMVMVKSIAVPAHGNLSFAPGGYHLMCMDPAKTMTPGGKVPVTLRFDDKHTLTAEFLVRNAAGK